MSQEPHSALPPLPGENRVSPVDDRFEHYRIFRREDGSLWELGHGSMGVTYKAVDTNLDKPVALKIISTQFLGKETSKKRFRREARSAASLHHRHIAGVYHLGESGGNFFYAMEYVDGETIEALVQRTGPLPWRTALGITLQITRALMAAHAKGLVHRDIKPANIMVVDEVDEQGVAKLIDFGLAKSAVEEEVAGSNVVTNASGFLGTPLYASPEQCEELPADIRSDIYSLGVTLWYMLTGEPPFQGSLARVIHQQFYTPPPTDKLPADLPPAARALLERMLAKDRAQRPQTPTDLRAEIEACLQTPASVSVVPSEQSRIATAQESTAKIKIHTERLTGATIVPQKRGQESHLNDLEPVRPQHSTSFPQNELIAGVVMHPKLETIPVEARDQALDRPALPHFSDNVQKASNAQSVTRHRRSSKLRVLAWVLPRLQRFEAQVFE